LDGTTITKFGKGTLLSATGCSSNNGTKSTPCLQADILGDWREEVIWRTSDNTALRIYTTTSPTTRRIYTLMHDPVYRLGIAWQNTAYNQPPHTGFFLGAGMAEPPVPQIYYAGPEVEPSEVPSASPTNTMKPSNTPTPSPSIKPITPEDVNNDGVINIADVMLIAAHFNTTASDEKYDRKSDINNDGSINIADIMMVAAKFNTVV
jgi:rhamnogalacturonan endolyase